MKCPACRSDCSPAARFCGTCGLRLPRICWSCGAEVSPMASYCHSCGVGLAERAVSASNQTEVEGEGRRLGTGLEPERRQATIMFCDLVGSTTLSASLDPEDLREVLHAFRDTAVTLVKKHGGFVASYMGDGILIFFGYPQAHEDDAERAVRAGLEIVAAVRALHLRPAVNLEVRIGIATGVVVIGDLIGEGASREEAVVGYTPNLAARLQSLAPPGGVIVSATTRRLIGNLYDCVDLGVHAVKGLPEAVAVWRVLGERLVESRFDAAHAGSDLTPLTGRHQELRVLVELWNLARRGTGQAVTLQGEPGIGKSRLAQALREFSESDSRFVLRYFSAERFQNTTLYPVIGQFERAAEFGREDDAATKLDKLEALLAKSQPPEQFSATVPYLAGMLSIPLPDRCPAIMDTPERQRERTLEILKAQVTGLAAQKPVMMICEDLHWADPTTLDLIQQYVTELPRVPVFILATGRPEFNPPWSGQPNTLTLQLSRLAPEDSTRIIAHLTGGAALPQPLLDHLLSKSDGIPLFVEELTKTVLESDLLREGGEEQVLGAVLANSVPSTLYDSLMARLDRLSAAKEVAQVGAAIGREFSYELLAALLGTSEAELNSALKRLTEADLIQCRGAPPDAEYVFRHALIQDAAYSSMLRARRQSLHGRIGELLETKFRQIRDSKPELLAHHFTESGALAKAIVYWQQAGVRAAARAAYTEATRYYQKGLELTAKLPEDLIRHGTELGLQVQLGLSLSASRGYAAPEVEAAYGRARALCHLLGDTAELYPVIRGLCTFYIVRDDLQSARELAEQCVRLGQETQRADYLIEGYTALGYTLVYMGDLQAGARLLELGIEVYRSRDGEKLTYPSAQDPGVACLGLLAIVRAAFCDTAGAVRCSNEAVALAERLGRPFNSAYAHSFAATLYNLHFLNDAAMAAEHAGRTIQISQEHGFVLWLIGGSANLAMAKLALGQYEEAIAMLGGADAAYKAGGAEVNRAALLAGLAIGHQASGAIDQAIGLIEEAINHADQHQEHFLDPSLNAIHGELLAARGANQSEWSAAFDRAVESARTQGAKLFELRALRKRYEVSLSKRVASGSGEELTTLVKALDKEGIDCVDPREARELLGFGRA